MTSLNYALGILVIDGVILGLVRKQVYQRNGLLAIFAIVGFVGFLFAANADDARNSLTESAKDSKLAPWLAFLILISLCFVQAAVPDNLVTQIAKKWNRETHNLLVIATAAVIFTAIIV
jgi:hypothetical protein